MLTLAGASGESCYMAPYHLKLRKTCLGNVNMCLAQSSVIHSSNLVKQALIKQVLGAQQGVGVLYAERSPGSKLRSLYAWSKAGSRVEALILSVPRQK